MSLINSDKLMRAGNFFVRARQLSLESRGIETCSHWFQ
jgi:hypothetical protein